MKLFIFVLTLTSLSTLCYCQTIAQETEPNDLLDDPNYYEAPVRIEGSFSSESDLDQYWILLSHYDTWTVSVYDECSTVTCTINPHMEVHHENEVQESPQLCTAIVFYGGSYAIIKLKSNGNIGRYGVVVTSERYSGWDGGCNPVVTHHDREIEPNDQVGTSISDFPMRMEADMSTVNDIDIYSIEVEVSGQYLFRAVPACTRRTGIPPSCNAGDPFVSIIEDSTNTQSSPNTDGCEEMRVDLNEGTYTFKVISQRGYVGGYALIVGIDGNLGFTNLCDKDATIVPGGVDIPPPPTNDPLGRMICDESSPNNRFEAAVGTLSVPFYIPTARLEEDGEDDFYYFGLHAGLYSFAILGDQDRDNSCVELTCEFDTVLRLYNRYGDLIALDDDSGSGDVCSALSIELETGNYYAVVSSFGDDSHGDYSLIGWEFNEGHEFGNFSHCENTHVLCPSGGGSGDASGGVTSIGYLDTHGYWWVILIILACILVIPLLYLFFLLIFVSGGCCKDPFASGTSGQTREPSSRNRNENGQYDDDARIGLEDTQ